MVKSKRTKLLTKAISMLIAVIMVVTLIPCMGLQSRAAEPNQTFKVDLGKLTESDNFGPLGPDSTAIYRASDGVYFLFDTLDEKSMTVAFAEEYNFYVLVPMGKKLKSVKLGEDVNTDIQRAGMSAIPDIFGNWYCQFVVRIQTDADEAVFSGYTLADEDEYGYIRIEADNFPGWEMYFADEEYIWPDCNVEGVDPDAIAYDMAEYNDTCVGERYSLAPKGEISMLTSAYSSNLTLNGEKLDSKKACLVRESEVTNSNLITINVEAGKSYSIGGSYSRNGHDKEIIACGEIFVNKEEELDILPKEDWPDYIDSFYLDEVNNKYVANLKKVDYEIKLTEGIYNAVSDHELEVNIPDGDKVVIEPYVSGEEVFSNLSSFCGSNIIVNVGKDALLTVNTYVENDDGEGLFPNLTINGEGKCIFNDKFKNVGKLNLNCDCIINCKDVESSFIRANEINISKRASVVIDCKDMSSSTYCPIASYTPVYISDGAQLVFDNIDVDLIGNLAYIKAYDFGGKITDVTGGQYPAGKAYKVTYARNGEDSPEAGYRIVVKPEAGTGDFKSYGLYSINYSDPNGTFKVTKGTGILENGVYKLIEGTEVEAIMLPNEGYQIDKNVFDIDAKSGKEPGSYSFIKPSRDAELSALFKKTDSKLVSDVKSVKSVTADIKGLVANGTVEVSIKDGKESEAMKKEAADAKFISYLDIKADNVIVNAAGDDWVTPVGKFQKSMKVDVTLNDADKNKKEYVVYKLGDNKVVKIDSTYDSSKNVLSFDAQSSSTYGIAYLEAADVKPAKKGKVLVDKKTGNSYKVTSSSKKNPTVAFVKTKNKKVKSVTVPKTVTINKVKYSVTTIGANAFAKCTKLTKVTIPASIKGIGKGAFTGCKKLKSVVIKTTKLTKKNVKAGAFKGIPAKAKVKVPKKSLKNYKKFFFKKGLTKKAKLVK